MIDKSLNGTRHPASVMVEAQRLHRDSFGALSLREIRTQLEKTHNVRPALGTIKRWIDPAYADRARERSARNERLYREKSGKWQFLVGAPGRTSPEYRDAFIRRLRAEGVPRTSIVRVCNVVLPEFETSRDDVYRALGEPYAGGRSSL